MEISSTLEPSHCAAMQLWTGLDICQPEFVYVTSIQGMQMICSRNVATQRMASALTVTIFPLFL